MVAVPHDVQVARLLDYYARASEDVRAEGRNWYSAQREMIRELARTHHIDVETIAAVVAALSPMTRWTENVAGAIRMLRAFEADMYETPPRNCTLFYRNAQKAWTILHGASPELAFANSPKVYAFWRNLVGDENAVTIDTWMLRAVGEEPAARNGAGVACVRRVQEAVRDAARRVGETPASFQAIVWVQIRREKAWFDTTKEAA